MSSFFLLARENLALFNILFNFAGVSYQDGETYSFSRLVDALRAYDAHIIKKKGDAVNQSDLNQPDVILQENNFSR